MGVTPAAPSPHLNAYFRWLEAGHHAELGYMARPDRQARRRDLNVILPGVRLGKDSLIGAGSVVTKDIPTGAVAVGSPAKVLGQRNELSCSAGLFDHAYAWLDEPTRREH